jgi:hypothetical protein
MIYIHEAISDSEIMLKNITEQNNRNHQKIIKELGVLSGELKLQWSEMARENYGSEELESAAHEIVEWYKNAMIGIPFANSSKGYPLPKERTLQMSNNI